MHLSNYNLFSFLVPEGEVLGNQTCSNHWHLVSSIFHSCPLPVYLEGARPARVVLCRVQCIVGVGLEEVVCSEIRGVGEGCLHFPRVL